MHINYLSSTESPHSESEKTFALIIGLLAGVALLIIFLTFLGRLFGRNGEDIFLYNLITLLQTTVLLFTSIFVLNCNSLFHHREISGNLRDPKVAMWICFSMAILPFQLRTKSKVCVV